MISMGPVPAGDTAVIDVFDPTVKLVALVAPNLTAVAPRSAVPVMVTVVPPDAGPLVGLTAVTIGATTYENRSAELTALVPPVVVTVMSTVPLPAGDVAVMDVAEFTVKLVALAVPNFTAVAPLSVVPVIVTVVAPVLGPLAGLTAVTTGAAM